MSHSKAYREVISQKFYYYLPIIPEPPLNITFYQYDLVTIYGYEESREKPRWKTIFHILNSPWQESFILHAYSQQLKRYLENRAKDSSFFLCCSLVYEVYEGKGFRARMGRGFDWSCLFVRSIIIQLNGKKK